MLNNVKVLMLLMVSGILLSQPSNKNDTVAPQKSSIPEAVKPTVEKIVENAQETRKLEEATSREMQKQLELMKDIKAKVLELKKSAKIKKSPPKEIDNKQTVGGEAIKEKEMPLEYNGQIVQWEPVKRTWFGRLLNTGDYLYYPYIVDEDGNKKYLK